MSGNVLAQAITLCGLPLLSRTYSPVDFGLLATYVALASFVAVFATLRYDLAVVLPKQHRDAAAIRFATRNIVLTVAGLATVATVGWVVVSKALGAADSVSPWFATLGILVLFTGETSILHFWFTRMRRYRVQSMSRVTQAAVTVGTQLALGLTVLPTVGGLIVGVLAGQLACVSFLLLNDDSREHRTAPNRRRNRLILYRYRRMPLLNVPNAAIDAARTNGILLLVGTRSIDVLGQFSMAMRIVQAPLGLIGSAISQVFYQKMASARPGELGGIVLGSVARSLALGLVPFAAIFFAAPTIIPWVLGEPWAQAGLIAQALTPWLYLNLATSPISNVFIVTGRQGTLLAFAAVYMAVPLACLVVVPGPILDAIVAMSASMTVLLIGLVFLARHVASRYDNPRGVREPSAG